NVLGFQTGGPGKLETLAFESYQARAVLAYLVNAAGHHVLKMGFDGQINKYTHDQTFSGGAAYEDGQDFQDAQGNSPPAGTVVDVRRYGYLVGTDVVADTLRIRTRSKSTILGGLTQESWTALDKWTSNLGILTDAL